MPDYRDTASIGITESKLAKIISAVSLSVSVVTIVLFLFMLVLLLKLKQAIANIQKPLTIVMRQRH